jgi:uncharacterized protein (TIGR02757 family)
VLRSSAPARLLDSDPLRYVHRYRAREDQELVGYLAASLAFGRVAQIFRSLDRVLAVLGPRPSRRAADQAGLARALRGFRHRWVRGSDVARLLPALARTQTRHGSLEAAFIAAGADFRSRVAGFLGELRCAAPGPLTRGLAFLIPEGPGRGANKRVLLFLRWMVRPPDGLDLGLWTSVRPRELLMPLDTHVAFLARALGLSARRSTDWVMAEQVTASLRQFDPEDPVGADFALSRLGILGRCRHRYDEQTCPACPLHLVCAVGRRARRPWPSPAMT